MKTLVLLMCLISTHLNLDSITNHVKSHIMKSEGLRLKPYRFQGQQLIGYGHAIRLKEKRLYNKGISKTKAVSLFDNDYNKLLRTVDNTYSHLSSTRKQVVVCLLYNMGSIPKSLHSRIQSNSDDLYLDRYVKSKGRKNKSLVARRKFEQKVWKLG